MKHLMINPSKKSMCIINYYIISGHQMTWESEIVVFF